VQAINIIQIHIKCEDYTNISTSNQNPKQLYTNINVVINSTNNLNEILKKHCLSTMFDDVKLPNLLTLCNKDDLLEVLDIKFYNLNQPDVNDMYYTCACDLRIKSCDRVYKFTVHDIPDTIPFQCIGTSRQTFHNVINLIKQHYDISDNFVYVDKDQNIIPPNKQLSMCNFADHYQNQSNKITFQINR
jgi:hypothetical protein